MGTFPLYVLSKWLKVQISNRFLLKWQLEKADGDCLGHVAHACSGHSGCGGKRTVRLRPGWATEQRDPVSKDQTQQIKL